MKILIISPGGLPITTKKGAIEKLVESYLDYNETIEDEITLYTPKISNTEYDQKNYKFTSYRFVDRTTLKFKISRLFYGVMNKILPSYIASAYIRSIVKDFKKRKDENYFDIIIFENGEKFIPYFKNKTKTSTKVVLHLHNDYINSDLKYSRKITEACNEIWTVSEFLKNRIKEINSEIPIKVLYNGVDDKLFKTKMTSTEKISLSRKLNIDLNKDFVYIYTGRLMPAKGVKELILAFKNVNDIEPDTKLLIVGGPKSITGKDTYTEELKKLSSNNPNIIMTGFVNTEDLYKYYSLSNAQIVPSTCNEAFGLTVLEAVINKLPVIATKIGGIPEILGTKAYYINKENIIEELEKTMIEIKKMDKETLQKLIENYNEITDKFSLNNYCQSFHKFLGGTDEKK